MTKVELLAQGMELMGEFCEANSLSQPSVTQVDAGAWRFDSTCAYYRRLEITICASRCAHPGTAGRAWSWPGYAIDRTPYGVIQHELGHHADWFRSDVKGAYGGEFSAAIRKASGEPKLTNYCPNDWEWFAEMFRLFVTNGDLLRYLKPRTHALLIDAGFRPIIDQPWREVLRDAPPRTIEMAAKKGTT